MLSLAVVLVCRFANTIRAAKRPVRYLEVPNASQQFLPSRLAFPMVFDVVTQEPLHTDVFHQSDAMGHHILFDSAAGYTISLNNGGHSILVCAGIAASPLQIVIHEVCWGVKASQSYRIKRSLWHIYTTYAMPWAYGACCFVSILSMFSMMGNFCVNFLWVSALSACRVGATSSCHCPHGDLFGRWLFIICLCSMFDVGDGVT